MILAFHNLYDTYNLGQLEANLKLSYDKKVIMFWTLKLRFRSGTNVGIRHVCVPVQGFNAFREYKF